MPIFHFLTVKPVASLEHELLRVQYGDYFISAKTQQAAWAKIKGWPEVADSTEVWAAKTDGTFQVTPDTKLHQQEQTAQHLHWARVQDRFHKIHSGPESLTQWADRRFEERQRNRATEAETRKTFSLYFSDLRQNLKAEGEGATVDQESEWETFISHGIEEGRLPAHAKSWSSSFNLVTA